MGFEHQVNMMQFNKQNKPFVDSFNKMTDAQRKQFLDLPQDKKTIFMDKLNDGSTFESFNSIPEAADVWKNEAQGLPAKKDRIVEEMVIVSDQDPFELKLIKNSNKLKSKVSPIHYMNT